jgi:hypothetical protein
LFPEVEWTAGVGAIDAENDMLFLGAKVWARSLCGARASVLRVDTSKDTDFSEAPELLLSRLLIQDKIPQLFATEPMSLFPCKSDSDIGVPWLEALSYLE